MNDMQFNNSPMRAVATTEMTRTSVAFMPEGSMNRPGVHHHHYHGDTHGGPVGHPNRPHMPFPDRMERQMDRMEQLLNKMTEMFQKLVDRLTQTTGTNGTTPGQTPGQTGGTSGTSGSGSTNGPVIAGTGRIWGDPHFVDPDGGNYDVQGEAGKTYNLLSDKNFQMNGRFDRFGKDGATVVGEVGISAGGDKITVRGDGDAVVNGRELKDGEKVALADGGYVEKNGDKVTVKVGEYEVKFDAETSGDGDYLNMDVTTKNANADGVKPHGLLGQAFDGDGKARNGDTGAGAQGGGAIETLANSTTQRGDKHTVSQYEMGDIHDTNFHGFNRFGSGSSDGSFSNTSMDDIMAMLDRAFGIMARGMQSTSFNQQPSMTFNYNDYSAA